MKIVGHPVDKSESSSEQGVPQVPPVQEPLLQIKSVASTVNVAVSMTSQQSGMMVTTQSHQQTDQCQKCGKKNHPTMHCHKKVTCRKCKGKDHSAKFGPHLVKRN